MNPIPHRRSHRRRFSNIKLLSPDPSTLPEYVSNTWIPSDTPPDYPDSAEEADEDTDSDTNTIYVPQLTSTSTSPLTLSSPKRSKRQSAQHLSHKRRHSAQLQRQQVAASPTSDPFLDSLLERSVHALEMSNTLLQSSISTQSSLSAVLASDVPSEHSLEARAQRLRGRWNEQEAWAEDLEEISRGVDGLLGLQVNPRVVKPSFIALENTVSSSLPISSTSPLQQHRRNRRRPSLELRHETEPALRLTPQNRSNLVSPPPRALTQLVASSNDPDTILIPSTIGLRASASCYPSTESRPIREFATQSTPNLHASPSLPQLIDKPLEPSTPAYNMLSSFVKRASSSSSSTPSSSFTASFMSRTPRRGSSNSNASTERNGIDKRRKSPSPANPSIQDIPSSRNSRSRTPKRSVSPLTFNHRPMTPPTEESSSSSDGVVAKLTVVSLRKILDDQPVKTSSRASSTQGRPPPAFFPRSPPPAAQASTSTATASISRLFTKGTHSSSTRPPSPPRQSIMKQPSPAGTSPTSPSISRTSTPSLPDMLVARAFGSSAPSSGRSTPKRISFAELPESYASTRPEGVSSGFKEKANGRGVKKRRNNGILAGKRAMMNGVVGSDSGSESGVVGSGKWWSGWLVGSSTGTGVGGVGALQGLGVTLARQEERREDRLTRTWSKMGAGFGAGLEDWGV